MFSSMLTLSSWNSSLLIFCYFLRLDTGFLLSPVEDRDTEADGNTRILRRVIINLFQMVGYHRSDRRREQYLP